MRCKLYRILQKARKPNKLFIRYIPYDRYKWDRKKNEVNYKNKLLDICGSYCKIWEVEEKWISWNNKLLGKHKQRNKCLNGNKKELDVWYKSVKIEVLCPAWENLQHRMTNWELINYYIQI